MRLTEPALGDSRSHSKLWHERSMPIWETDTSLNGILRLLPSLADSKEGGTGASVRRVDQPDDGEAA